MASCDLFTQILYAALPKDIQQYIEIITSLQLKQPPFAERSTVCTKQDQ